MLGGGIATITKKRSPVEWRGPLTKAPWVFHQPSKRTGTRVIADDVDKLSTSLEPRTSSSSRIHVVKTSRPKKSVRSVKPFIRLNFSFLPLHDSSLEIVSTKILLYQVRNVCYFIVEFVCGVRRPLPLWLLRILWCGLWTEIQNPKNSLRSRSRNKSRFRKIVLIKSLLMRNKNPAWLNEYFQVYELFFSFSWIFNIFVCS